MTQQAKLEGQVKQLTEELSEALRVGEELLREVFDVEQVLEEAGVPQGGSAAERLRLWLAEGSAGRGR